MHRRATLILAVAITVALAVPDTAEGATVRRTWTGSLGSSGANGRVTLHLHVAGTGVLGINATALRRSTSYTPEFRAGTCAALGKVLARAFPVATSATGTASTTRNLATTKMNPIVAASQSGGIVFRLVHPAGAVCANLSFRRATRIVIGALGIDLPVIAGSSGYPKCNVAMYLRALWQPREPGVTFLYAHARRGMFLPLLTRSRTNNGASLIGMTVRVYTTDSRVHTYRIDRVRRGVRSMTNAFGITAERLWLQTSEGPNSSYSKLIVEARRVSTGSTSYAASHPRARPVSC